MKKILIILFIFIQFYINAEDIPPLKNIFNLEEIEKIKNNEIIARMFLKYNPEKANTHLKIEIPVTKFTNENFSVYEMLVDEKAFIPYKINPESKLKFYNILTSYSKLRGMVYYSRRIAKTQELILNCFRVESPNNKKLVPDKIYDSIQPKIENYFLQEDNKFGKLLFKSELYNEENSFVMVNTCMQPIFPINNKEDYKMISFFIYDKESEGFYYYSLNAMRIRFALELLIKKTNATLFSNRLRAGTVHLSKLIGLDWSNKINPWDEQKLLEGKYRTY
jgi:hypothetical protein